jgi:cytochrome b
MHCVLWVPMLLNRVHTKLIENIKAYVKVIHIYTLFLDIQGDQKVSVHVMITIQKVTSNVQSVPSRQSPDIY